MICNISYLEVALGGEGSAANLALERSLTGVGAVVHLQRTFTGQHSMADDALVGIHQLILYVVHQLLELGRLRRPRHLDERLPRVVVGARSWQKVGVDGRIFGRIHVVTDRSASTARCVLCRRSLRQWWRRRRRLLLLQLP